jgi:hypothetical protein
MVQRRLILTIAFLSENKPAVREQKSPLCAINEKAAREGGFFIYGA